jgi:hypothetical protein
MAQEFKFTERYIGVVDRGEWPPGPWDKEPEDKLVWVDGATDLDCMLHRGSLGGWCGYVGLPPGHPFHGMNYDAVDELSEGSLEVHGGLTFSDTCRPSEAGPQYGICHIEQPGRPDPVWWLGFDCGHFMDKMPGMLAVLDRAGVDDPMDDPTGVLGRSMYKTMEYAIFNCTALARQLAEVSGVVPQG